MLCRGALGGIRGGGFAGIRGYKAGLFRNEAGHCRNNQKKAGLFNSPAFSIFKTINYSIKTTPASPTMVRTMV